MKLEDTYLRELLTRLDGGAVGTLPLFNPAMPEISETAEVKGNVMVESPELDRRRLNRAEAEAALEQRLAALRDQLSSVAGATSDVTPSKSEALEAGRGIPSPIPTPPDDTGDFIPKAPVSISELGLSQEEIESITLKYLLNRGACAGRQIADQLGLPFSLMEKVLFSLKGDQSVVQKGAAPPSDYIYQLAPKGLEDAHRYYKNCSYCGTLPVPLDAYIASVKAQSIRRVRPTEEHLNAVFSDLLVDEQLRSQVGQAMYGGKGFFLYGAPGNGKTSIAERVARAFGQDVWIPRALSVAGEIVRLYDPCNHEELATEAVSGISCPIDRRWTRIRRPTVIAGGELTMDRLEITVNRTTGVSEAPLQLKSNCGVLVIDDFGRQRMSVSELLNRWIVPLDRRYDFLNLPSGKTIQVPFDQLLVFSTNLEPRDLVDEAFLRRISYKIEVPDPSLDDFRKLLSIYAERASVAYDEPSVEYLVRQHYLLPKRPVRACHARDLLDHVRVYCGYRNQPEAMSCAAFDAAIKNYFGLMSGN